MLTGTPEVYRELFRSWETNLWAYSGICSLR